MTEVRTAEELLDALKRKDDEIRITGDYCAEIGGMVESHTAGTDHIDLTAGMINFAAIAESIVNKVKKVPKDVAKTQELLGLYKCTKFSAKEICLRLRQLDYVV